MITTLYKDNEITIDTNGTSQFMYCDSENDVYGYYDFTELEEFIEDICYLDSSVKYELIDCLQKYYE